LALPHDASWPELQSSLKSAALSALFLWALQGCMAHTSPAPVYASLPLQAPFRGLFLSELFTQLNGLDLASEKDLTFYLIKSII
jgi:hypothetical protein